jgi:hypothetical protein
MYGISIRENLLCKKVTYSPTDRMGFFDSQYPEIKRNDGTAKFKI